ncbi:MAG: ABC transporter ATP-binding protein, partial [Candidatus Aenigmatarchaeota archaeon]
ILDMVGCLLHPTRGKVLIDGFDAYHVSEKRRAHLRRDKFGFVFQQYNLMPSLTAKENVALAYRIGGHSRHASMERAKELLETVGLGARLQHRPSMLSGGESQRVAIARALANDPEIILADEPTGNLDTKTGRKILELMKWLDVEKGYTFLVVTHDPEVTRYSSRIIYLRDGKITREIIKKDRRIVKI